MVVVDGDVSIGMNEPTVTVPSIDGTNCSGIQSNEKAAPPFVELAGVGALVGVGGVRAKYGLSSCWTMSGTFCVVSDHGGLGFH